MMKNNTAFVNAAVLATPSFTPGASAVVCKEPVLGKPFVAAPRTARVTPRAAMDLYQHVDFGGRQYSTNSQNADLRNDDFNDLSSSCIITDKQTWILYSEINFQGQASVLDPGSYPNSTAMGIPNDQLSSIRPFPTPTDNTMLLFQDSGFRGRMVTSTESMAALGEINFNDKASSCIITGKQKWILYSDSNFQGQAFVLDPGKYPSSTAMGIPNDQLSSIRPFPTPTDNTILLFQDSGFRGRMVTFTESMAALSEINFNDLASSCIINGKQAWILYSDSNFQGQASVLDPGSYPNSTAMGIPNDRLSSIRAFPKPTDNTILLFQDSDFRGRMVTLRESMAALGEINFNDLASSAIVLSGTWKLFEHSNYGGRSITLGNGRYVNLNELGNDILSSLRPV